MPKMDNLKKYLFENRSSLDTNIPGDENWKRLSHTLSETNASMTRKRRQLVAVGIAASFLLASAGIGLWRQAATPDRHPPVQDIAVSDATPPPQAKAVSRVYSPVIYHQLEDLGKTSFYGHDRSVFQVFSLQWKALDTNEKAIEQNIRSAGPTDRLIQQLTDNYELKIRLLQRFSIEIKKVKDYLPPADTLTKIPSLSLLSIKTSNDEKK